MTTQQQQTDETAIRALIAKWSRALEAKDATPLVEDYLPDAVLYDAIPPYRTQGPDAIKALWEQCFPYFPEKFRSEHKDLTIDVSGDLAFVHGLHHFVPEPADHPSGATWMRVTACYRRVDGKWRVAHEHVSIPFDPMSGKASYIQDGTDAVPDVSAADKAAAQGMHRLTPHLVCAGAAKAIDFYKEAFGATELMRLPAPDGRLMHACVHINGSSVMLCDEFPEMDNRGPTSLKGTPVTLHLTVDDADAFADRAVKAGAKVIMPVADAFWGDRYGVVEDPFGHRWSIATPQRQVLGKDLEEAAKAAMSNPELCQGAKSGPKTDAEAA
jgi:PhnB protein